MPGVRDAVCLSVNFTSRDAENYLRRCKDCYLNIHEEYTNKLSVTLIFCPPYPFHTVNIVKTVSP